MQQYLDKLDILSLVKEIAYRMRNPEEVKAIVLRSDNVNPSPTFPTHYWNNISITDGYPGVLLLFASLDHMFPEEKWDAIAHQYVLKIKEAIESTGINTYSLYGGLAGTCFALQQASRLGTRYQKLINTCNSVLIQNVESQIFVAMRENLKNRQPMPMPFYDVIQGISGIGVSAMANLPTSLPFVQEIIKLSIAMTNPISAHGKTVPGWYLSVNELLHDKDKKRFPQGNFNLGLAHGIPGIMAFLSIALLKGIEMKGQREAIECVVEWIQSHQKQDQGNVFWPTMVSFENELNRQNRESPFEGRDAWCYGTPGVARSLFLAGKALKDDSLKQYALASFRAVFNRSRQQWHLPGPSFCHGISGLLTITQQMAIDTQEEDLQRHSYLLKDLLLEYYHSEHPFGFKDFSIRQDGGYAQLNQAGLLEGASGILLSLLSLCGLKTWWHAPFLIAEGAIKG